MVWFLKDGSEKSPMGTTLKVDPHDLPPTDRLIVLVPDFSIDEAAMGRRIWELAQVTCKAILLLSAVRNLDEEMISLHRLTALYACAQDRLIQVQTRLEFGLSWQKAVKQIWQPGSLIVCCQDHEIRWNLFQRRALGDLLAHDLKLPVYIIPDCFRRAASSGKEAAAWAGKVFRT
jgi:hypothetical protein